MLAVDFDIRAVSVHAALPQVDRGIDMNFELDASLPPYGRCVASPLLKEMCHRDVRGAQETTCTHSDSPQLRGTPMDVVEEVVDQSKVGALLNASVFDACKQGVSFKDRAHG